MDELVVVRCSREPIDLLLVDAAPGRYSNLVADQGR